MILKVNRAQLKEHLTQIKGGNTIITIDTQTEVDMRKKNNPYYGRVTKITRGVNAMIFKTGAGFKNKISRRLQEEFNDPTLEYQPKERKWGQRIKDTPILEHNGEEYLEYIALNSSPTVTYYLDGKEIPKSLIEEYLKTSSNGYQGGITDKVIIRVPKLNSIVRVRKDKQELHHIK